jgi:trehalose-6-phosphate hydrolase
VVSRLGCDQQYRVESAKILASALHMMQGTPYIYQGEEIGMTNPGYTSIEKYRDLESTNNYSILVDEKGINSIIALDILAQKSRDNSRAPMQWDSSENAGFSKATPWIGIADNYPEINAKQAVADPNSVFHYYRKLIKLRKDVDVISSSDFTDLMSQDPQLFFYQRKSAKKTLISINNFYSHVTQYNFPESLDVANGTYLLSNYEDCMKEVPTQNMSLQPYESRILLIEH